MASENLPAGHVSVGAGEAHWVGGEHITFKVRSGQTGAAVALIEDEVQPGMGHRPTCTLTSTRSSTSWRVIFPSRSRTE